MPAKKGPIVKPTVEVIEIIDAPRPQPSLYPSPVKAKTIASLKVGDIFTKDGKKYILQAIVKGDAGNYATCWEMTTVKVMATPDTWKDMEHGTAIWELSLNTSID
jgi:hypothetical protein